VSDSPSDKNNISYFGGDLDPTSAVAKEGNFIIIIIIIIYLLSNHIKNKCTAKSLHEQDMPGSYEHLRQPINFSSVIKND